MSIWWFIGLSQITLISLLGCIFWSIALKNSKQQNKHLKINLAKTAQDYEQFVKSMEEQLHILTMPSQTLPDISQKPHPKAYVIDRVISLQKELDESWQHLESFQLKALLDSGEVKQGLEKLFLAVLTCNAVDLDSSLEQWDNITADIQNQAHSFSAQYNDIKMACDDLVTQWSEKRVQLHQTFNMLVKSTQKAENSAELHDNLNKLYNSFIELLNLLPGLAESTQDAHLKMEAIELSDDLPAVINEANIPTLKPLSEQKSSMEKQLLADESPADIQSSSDIDDIFAEVAISKASSPLDNFNPDDLLALSEEHEEELPAPASAIEDFEPDSSATFNTDNIDQLFADAASQQKKINAEENSMAARDPEKIIDESLGIDNDIFDDLMSDMDDALTNKASEKKDQKES